jgi:hypothetical protein
MTNFTNFTSQFLGEVKSTGTGKREGVKGLLHPSLNPIGRSSEVGRGYRQASGESSHSRPHRHAGETANG